jgi:serine/threonine-protein kinase
VKIMDFGVARIAGYESLTVAGSTPGTAAYMAPEQVDSSELDHRIDIWALGVVLYEMVAGFRPFGVGNPVTLARAIVEDVQDPLAHGRLDVPPMLDAVVSKALAKRPVDRYQTAAEMAADLEALARQCSADERTAVLGKAAPSGRSWVVTAAIVAALVIFAIFLGWFFAAGAA